MSLWRVKLNHKTHWSFLKHFPASAPNCSQRSFKSLIEVLDQLVTYIQFREPLDKSPTTYVCSKPGLTESMQEHMRCSSKNRASPASQLQVTLYYLSPFIPIFFFFFFFRNDRCEKELKPRPRDAGENRGQLSADIYVYMFNFNYLNKESTRTERKYVFLWFYD